MADEKTRQLMTSWGFEGLISKFQEEEITLDALLALTRDDIKLLIPKVGRQSVFFKKITDYKQTVIPEIDSSSVFILQDTCLTPPRSSCRSDLIQVEDCNEADNGWNDSVSTPQYASTSTLNLSGTVLETPLTHIDNQVALNKIDPSNSIVNIDELDLEALLKSEIRGIAILNTYKAGGLDSKCRNLLVELIITHCMSIKNNYLENKDLRTIADKIVDLFPKEHKAVYFVSPISKRYTKLQKGEIARGKLTDKYRNLRTFLRKSKVLGGFKEKLPEQFETSSDLVISEESTKSKDWLQYHSEPFEDVQKHWRQTIVLRNQFSKTNVSIDSFINEWPILKCSLGYTLLIDDFDRNYPIHAQKLYSKWEFFFEKLLKIRQSQLHAQDSTLVGLLRSDNINTDSKTALQISLLSSLVPPKGRKCFGKIHWKPSIQEAQDGLLIHVYSPSEIDEAIEKKISKSLCDVTSVYVYLNEIVYKIPSVLNAFDACFKMYHVLDAKYPPECEHLWYIIQFAVYEFHTERDKKISYVLDITKQMEVLE
ncbi:hypothetical protein FQR65_LT17786 [Abscondita terminalis]|nr:hypothetical protein FQR65_LT17786 [Abscondita terminalis]